MDQNT